MRDQANSKKAIKAHGLAVILAVTAGFILTGCKGGGLFNGKLFKERAAEKPAPHDEGIEKSFFVNPDGKPKTFLCASAPEIGRGDGGEEELTAFQNMTSHCNVEFEITENYLIAKRIHPSFLNDRSRWEEFVKIPIRAHYYYERQKDPHGRETNEWVENSSRSHWSARPMMKLDLASAEVPGFGGGKSAEGYKVSSVEDIEWDRKNFFLGFSANMVWQGTYRSNTAYGGRVRVNFLQFEHDPTFKKIPYNVENARYMNLLHILGRKIEGMEQELYTGHWDLRQPHTIYLNGVPSEHEPTVRTVIDRWNQALRETGVIGKDQVAFKVEVRNSKHPFDLRYPAINWISDRRISAKSALGIGMAHADVRNGKILWGGITIWGGALEGYINHYTPIESIGSSMTSGMTPFQSFAPYMDRSLEPLNIGDAVQASGGSLRDAISSKLLEKEARSMPGFDKVVSDFTKVMREKNALHNQTFKHTNLLKMLNQKLSEDETMSPAREQLKNNPELRAALREKDLNRRAMMLSGPSKINSSAVFIESELNAENLSGSFMASSAQKTRTYPEMLESVVMDLTMHEFGHMIGLGHQFKENIVPKRGTVPNRFVDELAAKATPEKEFTNYTSVMGYRSGRTSMIIPASEIWPGPHDKLVLRYLYKGEYSLYDDKADDFVYAQVPATGKIPARSTVTTKSGSATLPVSYFPACNDYEASLDADPYCNRWDRGSSAQDIIKSYFEYISDNLLASLYNVVGGGGNHWNYEYRMWRLSLNTFSRTRLFYDEMRRRLRSDPALVPIWNRLRQDTDSLFEFETACMAKDPTGGEVKSGILRDLFKDPEIVDLCRANNIALKEYEFFLNLPAGDYTKIDHTNRYISGGYLEGDVSDTRFNNFMGAWYQLSNFPMKFSALFTLTTANPYQFNPWYGITPNYYFHNEENRFLYRTLYPRTYTKLISSSAQNNMRFTANGLSEYNTIGRTILATSSLLPHQRYTSNDAARLPDNYDQMLDQQTKFEVSMVAVIISPQESDAKSGVKPYHYKKFTAKIFDFFSNSQISASEVYLLPQGKIIVSAPGMFIYPITPIKFFDGLKSYVIAYKVAYDYQQGDKLAEASVKYAISDKHNEILMTCFKGFNGNGLRRYFDNVSAKDPKCQDKVDGKLVDSEDFDFDGFYIPDKIAEETEKDKSSLFYKSIDDEFAKYEIRSKACGRIPRHFPIHSMTNVCNEAVAGIGVASSTAAILNGFWLDIAVRWLEK